MTAERLDPHSTLVSGPMHNATALMLRTRVAREFLTIATNHAATTHMAILAGRCGAVATRVEVDIVGYAELQKIGAWAEFIPDMIAEWRITSNRLRRTLGDVEIAGWICFCKQFDDELHANAAMFHRTFFNAPHHVMLVCSVDDESITAYAQNQRGHLVPVPFSISDRAGCSRRDVSRRDVRGATTTTRGEQGS